MKKSYCKPEILFENFAMSTNIAAGCYFKTNLQGENACGYETRNGVIFVSDLTGCEYHEPDTNDTLCYNVPNEDYDIFNS